MDSKPIRVRFAPSPTGGLHIGGLRTALFNYLFAKKNNGTFILRIEDTDQNRLVAEAENYIYQCLDWCHIPPNESPKHAGRVGPYIQSQRKELYQKYAQELISKGFAYYAFDTAEELTNHRNANPNFQYQAHNRLQLKNSLTLSQDEVNQWLTDKKPYCIRLKVNPNEHVAFNDDIRGHISVNTNFIDDKILIKNDGLPTYHLAVVVDDFLMEITHVFRGEEWLSTAPIHVLLWQYLFGENNMPRWVHLPVILKPNGKGKLSKRDGDSFGIPVYGMHWGNDNLTKNGFKECGFLPQALINFLALLGWNPGTEKEVYTLHELAQLFSIEHIQKGDAIFDYEKAKWFNHQWIMKLPAEALWDYAAPFIKTIPNINSKSHPEILQLMNLVKERCVLLTDFIKQLAYFFEAPKHIAMDSIKSKWDDNKQRFFEHLTPDNLETNLLDSAASFQDFFTKTSGSFNLQLKDIQLPLRLALVGDKFGPDVFKIAENLGKTEVIKRIQYFTGYLHQNN